MDTVLLAAGYSRRMGKQNKLFLKYQGKTLLEKSVNAALSGCSGRIIIVTGYQSRKVADALEKNSRIIAVENIDYMAGQFSSVLSGLPLVEDGQDFFISLADLPLITADHYKKLSAALTGFDAVRPSFLGKPGHPVLLKSWLKQKILTHSKDDRVKNILRDVNVNYPEDGDKAWITDIDYPEDYERLLFLASSRTFVPSREDGT